MEQFLLFLLTEDKCTKVSCGCLSSNSFTLHPPISSNRSQCSFSPINPYGESIYNWCCTHSNSSMSGITVWTPDTAVSHLINRLAHLTDPGWAECVSICVLHVRDVRCPLGRDWRGGCWCVPARWVRSRGVRGELKQRDGLHLSAWPTLKWPSLRID